MNTPLAKLIVREKNICGGEPVFAGTRVTLRSVLASLADGDSIEEITRSFPTVVVGDVRLRVLRP